MPKSAIINIDHAERCPSGRRSTVGNRVGGNVSWVRIPLALPVLISFQPLAVSFQPEMAMIPELVPIVEKLQSRVDTKRISLEFPSAHEVAIVPSAEDTFPVWVMYEEGVYHVGAAEWCAQFESAEQAGSVICWLLTPFYRIVRSVGAGNDIATWIELYTDQGWEGTEYSYFTERAEDESPLEGANQIIILQQAVFLDSAFATYYPAAHLDQAGYPVGTILGETRFENQNGEWHPVGVPIAE